MGGRDFFLLLRNAAGSPVQVHVGALSGGWTTSGIGDYTSDFSPDGVSNGTWQLAGSSQICPSVPTPQRARLKGSPQMPQGPEITYARQAFPTPAQLRYPEQEPSP
jgi:hypothetical protein